MRSGLIPTLMAAALFSACAHKRAITGTIIDRNGQPMDRVVISVDPGGVEVITDAVGNFRVDYLRDERGNRIHLTPRKEYRIEAFRPGFHVTEYSLYYKRGQFSVETLTLVEDSIQIQPSELSIDPAEYPERSHSSGSTYEGE